MAVKSFDLFVVLVVLLFSCSISSSSESCDGLEVHTHVLDERLYFLWWHGDDNKNVLALTLAGSLYRSSDEGVSLEKLDSNVLENLNVVQPYYSRSGVRFVYNTADPEKVIVQGWAGIWVSSDNSETFTYVETGYGSVLNVKPHPSDANKMFAKVYSDDCLKSNTRNKCTILLVYSTDFGASWSQVDSYVRDAYWGKTEKNKDSIVYLQYMNKTGNIFTLPSFPLKLIHTKNYGSSGSEHISNVHSILVTDGVIFVANYSSTSKFNLIVSTDDLHTHRVAKFPSPMNEIAYSILSAVDTALIFVYHQGNQNWGNVYSSGPDFKDFGFVLEHVRFGRNGFHDFQPVRGLEGIFMSNYYPTILPSTEGETEETEADPELSSLLQTVMSHDNAGRWDPIDPPDESSCQSGQDCSLNLLGQSESYYQQPYTADNAIGLLFGSGRIGADLGSRNNADVWFSRDAGWTWKRIIKGHYTYELGHHGSLMILIPMSNSDSIRFSEDQGTSDWKDCLVSDKEFSMYNAVIEPTYKSQKFLLYGKSTSSREGYLASLDFSSLHERECTGLDNPDSSDSDFETWSPHDTPNGGENCLLGMKKIYTRRKADAECFFSSSYEPVSTVGTCQCRDEDYECDEMYTDANDIEGSCVKIDGSYDPTTIPKDCDDTYQVSRGYRKVAGTNCSGTVPSKESVEFSCKTGKPVDSSIDFTPSEPSSSASSSSKGDKSHNKSSKSNKSDKSGTSKQDSKSSSSGSMLTIIIGVAAFLVVVLVVGVAFVVVKSKRDEGFREWVTQFTPGWFPLGGSSNSTDNVEYSPLGVSYDDEAMLDDEAFGDDEDELVEF